MQRSVRLLQGAVALGGVVPVAAGLAGIVVGPAMVGPVAASVSLDSHFAYLSGLLLAIGLAFWSTIPRIATQTARFRLLTLLVVAGGLGRLVALAGHGVPGLGMLGGLAMELGVTPLLCVWQGRVCASQP